MMFEDFEMNIDMTDKYTLQPQKLGGCMCCCGTTLKVVHLE